MGKKEFTKNKLSYLVVRASRSLLVKSEQDARTTKKLGYFFTWKSQKLFPITNYQLPITDSPLPTSQLSVLVLIAFPFEWLIYQDSLLLHLNHE